MPDLHFGKELVPGTRLVVSRRGYRHHGIYAGQGRVIHYAGRVRHPRGRIEEIAVEDFVANRPVQIGTAPDSLRAREILKRARSRLGECRYDLLSNNCEHFCNWCQLGIARSQQVESLTRPLGALVRAAVNLAAIVPLHTWSRATARPALFSMASSGQKWHRFLTRVARIDSADALAASAASLAKRWSS